MPFIRYGYSTVGRLTVTLPTNANGGLTAAQLTKTNGGLTTASWIEGGGRLTVTLSTETNGGLAAAFSTGTNDEICSKNRIPLTGTSIPNIIIMRTGKYTVMTDALIKKWTSWNLYFPVGRFVLLT